jgi:hypothetical protein
LDFDLVVIGIGFGGAIGMQSSQSQLQALVIERRRRRDKHSDPVNHGHLLVYQDSTENAHG